MCFDTYVWMHVCIDVFATPRKFYIDRGQVRSVRQALQEKEELSQEEVRQEGSSLSVEISLFSLRLVVGEHPSPPESQFISSDAKVTKEDFW